MIMFDPDIISYESILEHMMSQHSPTSPPHSRQYRSAILVYTQSQLEAANETVRLMALVKKRPIYTDVEDANKTKFYAAEPYHQKYIEKEYNANQGGRRRGCDG